MAVSSAQVSVTTAATLLSAAETDDRSGSTVTLTNTAAVSVFLGSASVTTANGFPLAGAAAGSWDLGPGESLYAVVASGTATVGVLRTGV